MCCICAVVLTTPCRLDKVCGPGDHHPGDGLQTEVGAPAGKLVGPGSGQRTDGSEINKRTGAVKGGNLYQANLFGRGHACGRRDCGSEQLTWELWIHSSGQSPAESSSWGAAKYRVTRFLEVNGN